MNQSDFEQLLYEHHCGTRYQCKEAVRALLDAMFKAIDAGDTVILRRIGTLYKTKPRTVHAKLPSLKGKLPAKQDPTIRFNVSRAAREILAPVEG